jgi:hypothetical protein
MIDKGFCGVEMGEHAYGSAREFVLAAYRDANAGDEIVRGELASVSEVLGCCIAGLYVD